MKCMYCKKNVSPLSLDKDLSSCFNIENSFYFWHKKCGMPLVQFLEQLRFNATVTIEDESHCGYYVKIDKVSNVLDSKKVWLLNKFNKVEYDKIYGFIIEIKKEKEN